VEQVGKERGGSILPVETIQEKEDGGTSRKGEGR